MLAQIYDGAQAAAAEAHGSILHPRCEWTARSCAARRRGGATGTVLMLFPHLAGGRGEAPVTSPINNDNFNVFRALLWN